MLRSENDLLLHLRRELYEIIAVTADEFVMLPLGGGDYGSGGTVRFTALGNGGRECGNGISY